MTGALTARDGCFDSRWDSDMAFANAGSQRWIQVAVNRRPDVLLSSLREAGAISESTTIDWASPLERDGCCEYRDAIALRRRALMRFLSEL